MSVYTSLEFFLKFIIESLIVVTNSWYVQKMPHSMVQETL